jgi:hypothetical protein
MFEEADPGESGARPQRLARPTGALRVGLSAPCVNLT